MDRDMGRDTDQGLMWFLPCNSNMGPVGYGNRKRWIRDWGQEWGLWSVDMVSGFELS